MKQQAHNKLNDSRTRKNSEPQMGFEPKTLRDLVGCSNHWTAGDSMVSKGQFMGLDWNRITRLHSQVMTGTYELTNSIWNPIWGSVFFRVLQSFNLSCACCFIFNILTLEVGWLHLDML